MKFGNLQIIDCNGLPSCPLSKDCLAIYRSGKTDKINVELFWRRRPFMVALTFENFRICIIQSIRIYMYYSRYRQLQSIAWHHINTIVLRISLCLYWHQLVSYVSYNTSYSPWAIGFNLEKNVESWNFQESYLDTHLTPWCKVPKNPSGGFFFIPDGRHCH